MEERDIENYDYLSVTLKKSTEKELLRCYDALGWERTEVKEDKLYVDVTHYEMRRPHKIKDKDKLQLLQVRVETEVNKMAKLAHDRHDRSTAFTALAVLLAAAFIASGVFFILYFNTLAFYITGGVLCGLGAAAALICAFFIRRLREWENGVCESKIHGCMARLQDVFARIGELTEGANGR